MRIRSLFEDFVSEDSFELYVNRMNYSFIKLVQEVPGWRATNLYEEGFAAYSRKLGVNPTRKKGRLVNLRAQVISILSGYGIKSDKQTFYTDQYKTVFATSRKAFADFPRREIVDIRPIIKASIKPSGYPSIPQNSLIFVLPLHNAFSSNQRLRDRLLECMEGVMKSFPERPVVLKPHPDIGDDNNFWAVFYDMLSYKTGVDITKYIRSDFELEELAVARKDVIFCTVISSMAVYAGSFDMSLISIGPAVFGHDDPRVINLRNIASDAIFVDTPNGVLQQLRNPQNEEGI